ncbi:ABC transporter substrate-binding protein [Phytoactinopolyspora mesophila]|uniref:ABC transporter substrate-binding protein n=1 Tax=Phytoactinopolyspora mesophila TaxID=2650750 RepID=A0A7K3M8H9_9ACTN|nr:ABC transporter substrate-binding protein [Phytoactinopolyspora mesophila]NDL59626.1 ABC transporter substrate-binding protein [Phytoactinopolyspora mesophila]
MKVTRITATLAAFALALTACGGDDGDDAPGADDNGNGAAEEGDEPEVQRGGAYTTIITGLHATAPPNPYNPDGNSFAGYNSVRLAWVKNHPTSPTEFYPGLASEWEVTDDNLELTVTLHPDATWSDGTPVTADDVVVSSNIAYTRGSGAFILDPGAAGAASDIEVIDDKTVQFTQDPENPTREFVNGIMNMIIVPAHIYGDLLPDDFDELLQAARGEDDAADDAREAISEAGEDVVSFAPEEDISAGPYVLERINPSEALLVRNEHFHNDHLVAPDQVIARNYDGNEQVWDYLQAGELDSSHFVAVPEDVVQQIEARPGNEASRTYSPVVAGLAFNQTYEPFDDINVRRALAYIIDREQMVAVSTPDGGTAATTTSGIHQEVVGEWIGDTVGDLDPYAVDLDRAAEELEAAGLSEENGRWVLPDGDPFSVPIQVPGGFSDWIAAGENIATQLNEFGIDSEIRTSPDFTVYQEEMTNGEYPVGFWLIGLGPSPYNIYQRLYGSSNGWEVLAGRLSYNEPGESGNWKGGPETYDVEGHGEVNPGELAHELRTADEERTHEIMTILAQTTNEHLPVIQMWDYVNTQFSNTDRFITDPPDDARRVTGVTSLAGIWIQQGWVTAVN